MTTLKVQARMMVEFMTVRRNPPYKLSPPYTAHAPGSKGKRKKFKCRLDMRTFALTIPRGGLEFFRKQFTVGVLNATEPW